MNSRIIIAVISAIVVSSVVISISFTTEINDHNVTKTKITDIIPSVVFGGEEASIRTTNIADVKDEIVFTIEGTILEFVQPIEHVDSRNRASAAIPVTMSVEQVHKGNLSTKTFTFFLHSWVILNPSQISEIEDIQDFTDKHRKMYVGQDYSNVEKQYKILYHDSLFEIGDKVIVHIKDVGFGKINYLYEEDEGLLEPYYDLKLGPYGYYIIQDQLAFNKKYPTGVAVDNIIVESLS